MKMKREKIRMARRSTVKKIKRVDETKKREREKREMKNVIKGVYLSGAVMRGIELTSENAIINVLSLFIFIIISLLASSLLQITVLSVIFLAFFPVFLYLLAGGHQCQLWSVQKRSRWHINTGHCLSPSHHRCVKERKRE